jgi:N-acetylmuramoyl-L-alanine amidase
LNRVNHKEYPNTIYGVIFDKKFGVQYSPTADGRIYNTPNKDSVNAAKSALEGYNNIGNSMYFYNPKKSSGTWIKNNRIFYTTIGNHNFHL